VYLIRTQLKQHQIKFSTRFNAACDASPILKFQTHAITLENHTLPKHYPELLAETHKFAVQYRLHRKETHGFI